MAKRMRITKQMVNRVMKDFPWAKAADLYRLMGWKWGSTGGGIPFKSDLRRHGRELLEDLRTQPDVTSIEAGGLRAKWRKIENAWSVLTLEFVALHSCATS